MEKTDGISFRKARNVYAAFQHVCDARIEHVKLLALQPTDDNLIEIDLFFTHFLCFPSCVWPFAAARYSSFQKSQENTDFTAVVKTKPL
jgi:hypothetical protein